MTLLFFALMIFNSLVSETMASVRYYKYEIETTVAINKTCDHKGKQRKSQITAAVPLLASVQDGTIEVTVKVSVCPLVGSLKQRTFALPLPKAMIENPGQAWAQGRQVVRASEEQFDQLEILPVGKSGNSKRFQLTLSKAGKKIEGVESIVMEFVGAQDLRAVPGFIAASEIPLRSIDIESSEVSIKSKLRTIEIANE